MRWSGSGQPEALTRVVSRIPRSTARSFIRRAKAASVPESPSATTTVASLPDCTTMPWMSSSTVGRSRSLRNIVEPPIARASGETGKRVSRSTRPSSRASNSM